MNTSPSGRDNVCTDPDKNGGTATKGIAVGVSIALFLMLVFTAVVLVCWYRSVTCVGWRRQREPPNNGKESRDAVPLPDILYGEVDMEAKAHSRRKRQEEGGDGQDKEGDTVVNNDLYGSVSSNNYPIEKEDTCGCVNSASNPPGWEQKKVEAAPTESYTKDDALREPDGGQKRPVQSDMETGVDEVDGGGSGYQGDEDGSPRVLTQWSPSMTSLNGDLFLSN